LRVLVTGGAGYIGSHTVKELLEAGHQVTVIDDLSKGHRQAVLPGVTLVESDLADPHGLRRAVPDTEAVLHFAGRISVAESVEQPGAYWRANVAGPLALLEAMERHGVARFVFSSTCAVYGMPVRSPMDEGHPQDPVNPYGASKGAFERALRDHARRGSIRAVALRYFNAAGNHPDGSLGEDHRPEEHLVPRALDAALGRGPALAVHGEDYDTPDGTCVRDYVHVQDLARAHVLALAALDRPDAGFEAVNLGTGRGHSVREVVAEVERVAGRPVPWRSGPRRPGDPPRLVASIERARGVLGFEPRHTELGGIIETALRWRRDHPEGYGA
jgi:UDP-glucose-4-epimerase GalE